MSKAKTCDGLHASREHGDVGDAAEIQRDAAEFGVAIEKIVGVGDERCALAAEGDVGGAEVGDGGDAGAGGDDGWPRRFAAWRPWGDRDMGPAGLGGRSFGRDCR